MLARHPQQRSNTFNNTFVNQQLPSPAPSHSSFSDHLPTTASPDFNLQNYLNTLPYNFDQDSTIEPSSETSFMNNFDYTNSPAIRVQQSTPVPQLPGAYSQSGNLYEWDMFSRQQGNNNNNNNNHLQTPQKRVPASHRRAPSTSSAGSDFSSASNNTSANASATVRYPADESTALYSKQTSLPTPTQTPTSESFLSSSYQTFNSQPNLYTTTGNAHDAMRNILQDTTKYDDDYSVSSYGRNSPATPHNDDFEEVSRISNGENPVHDDVDDWLQYLQFPPDVASNFKFESQDMWNRPMMGKSLARPTPKHLSPQQFQSIARSQSPQIQKPASPFKPTSTYMGSSHRLNASQLRDQQQQSVAAEASSAMRNYQQAQQQPKTISPKEVSLDYDNSEDTKNMSLFPENDSESFGQQFNSGNQFGLQPFGNTEQASWNIPRSGEADFTTPSSAANYNFMAPVVPQGLPQVQFTQQQYRSISNMPPAPEPTPDFPAHLTSMESSASEAGLDNSFEDVRRPENVNADRGTYSCTYQNCSQRFETPRELQKHKREGHRQNVTHGSPGVGSHLSSAELMERNSQAGPHICKRTNPSTGKPCNTEFSRPYDLTRHEDTIHNIRKQKVRCALCIEEKTFSRNDALTRHMRVVHPEVDFPGKHRRRGGAHD
ncbi:hypothetical protein EJ05DRAFT_498968 [Pseudovirgaria hyperparasitica]|uniref:C2H2-type domain-containing protein n=1 Tax=Pseudovirgaria hyperparasitica TaxID=470096 RepID=A0A6A6WD37_9PEZI|nr:uncharacterized protein EJ05DRAFT_498968 [Pseudovirgaria hyperparasitica]KAF2759766.1 hypothetical protein EJ05DRAFT_498968 [Pseudovirgaria hyperparasitica]